MGVEREVVVLVIVVVRFMASEKLTQRLEHPNGDYSSVSLEGRSRGGVMSSMSLGSCIMNPVLPGEVGGHVYPYMREMRRANNE